ncbi:T9SS C-terminal target domain-containing protein [Flavobacterium sp. 3HN19-14]|uniref:T9SS C-terminal target domain-containing protein n=1 Tax=Flavobacterium sp. 3HN19-14 TaxID=3448133 RepID=UPI003EDF9E91
MPWNGLLWTHNDSDDATLYALDTISGSIVSAYPLPLKNHDWEELSQDQDNFYLGDIGNNFGKRNVLSIYKIDKSSLLAHQPKIDTITFSWPETIAKGEKMHINFNCEAMAVIGDSIYLFTKEYQKTRQTQVFSIPSKPGNYVAKYKATLKTRVLVTGANYNEKNKTLALCGYNLTVRPFILLFSAFENNDFFSGKMRKIRIKKRFRQTEGIASFDGKSYYTISEDLQYSLLHTPPTLQKIVIEDN